MLKELFEGFCIFLVAAFVLSGIVLAFAFPVSAWSCESKWAAFKPKFTLGAGCTIEVNGVRIPSSTYRVL